MAEGAAGYTRHTPSLHLTGQHPRSRPAAKQGPSLENANTVEIYLAIYIHKSLSLYLHIYVLGLGNISRF